MEQNANAESTPAEPDYQKLQQSLIEWSKWVITISFSAGTGCVVVFNNNDPESPLKVGPLLFTAIFFFAASVFQSVRFTYLLIAQYPEIVLQKRYKREGDIQFCLFIAAFAYLVLWIAKPVFPMLLPKHL